MNRKFTRLICVLAVLALTLSGCALIKVDTVKDTQDKIDALNTSYDTVIAEYKGGNVTIKDVTAAYQSNYTNTLYYYYYYYGTTDIPESMTEGMRSDVLENAVQTAVCVEHAADMGITLTDEEKEECKKAAEDTYNEYYASYRTNYSEGETAEEKDITTRYQLLIDGIDKDIIYRQNCDNKILTKLTEKLENDVEPVTEDEIKAAYNAKTEEDKALYGDDLSAAESAVLNGTDVYWYPEGFRAVKHILIVPGDEALTAYKDAKAARKTISDEIASLYSEHDALLDDDTDSERTPEDVMNDITEAQTRLTAADQTVADCAKACVADAQETVDAVYARIEAGEDFSDLVLEYDADTDKGMIEGASARTGYLICAGSTSYVDEFTEGAMALENVGDVTEPVVSEFGIHIIKYMNDIPEGPVSFDSVREALAADLLSEKKDTYYNETVKAWVDEVSPVYYYDRWTNN